MEEQTLETLIDLYLLGTISPMDKTQLERAMADDPSVAAMVQDSKRAYKALLLERNRLLKEKLKMLDKEDMPEPKISPRKWRLLFSTTGILILVFLMLNTYQSPRYIARRNLLEYRLEGGSTKMESQQLTSWENARMVFLDNDFEKAIQDYLVLAGDKETPGHFEARWNILMVQLAGSGPTPAWYHAMASFSDEAPYPLSGQAKRMTTKFTSMYYRFFFSPWKEKFSSLKPRLI